MPILSKSQNLTINGGQFTDITNNCGPNGIDILLEASCPEAAHDAAGRENSPRCFPGTRYQYIQDFIHWSVPALGCTPLPLYWMKGPAGCGKSAIAQTCAEELKKLEKLGAAFFFSINGRDDPQKFFPSIAYQLSTIHPPYRDLLDNKLRHDKTLVNKMMRSQFSNLIEEPLRKLASQGKEIGKRVVIIVDGLDECEGTDTQCEIINIVRAVSDGAFPLCWAFFSRSEPQIEATLAINSVDPRCHVVELPISHKADSDIECYLMNEFKKILQRRKISMESHWPSTEDMETLVGAARGSFIYATTVARFVDHLGPLVPQQRLRIVIDTILDRRERDPQAGTSLDAPFAELDAFYKSILQRIPPEIFPSVYLLLALICQWGTGGAILIANVLGMSKDEFEAVCNHASAVVHLQDPGRNLELDPTIDTSCTYTQLNRNVLIKPDYLVRHKLGGRVSFYHKSFSDFLEDPARSGSYCVKESDALKNRYLKMHLKYNRTYCWEGSRLVITPDVADSGSLLSYPYTNELINSILKARAYIEFGAEDPKGFSALNGFGTLDANCDFRKCLYVATHLLSGLNPLPRSGRLWGCKERTRLYPGTWICWIALAKFDVNKFKLMIKQHRQANTIQRYYPTLSSRIKSVSDKIGDSFESAFYRVGHGEKSIFWYWEIDYELGHYKHFETVDLTEGEKRFREEDFASWP